MAPRVKVVLQPVFHFLIAGPIGICRAQPQLRSSNSPVMQTLRYLRNSRRVTLGLVTCAIFADTFVYDMVVPFLPDYLKKWALGEAEVGLLFGSYALALLGTAPL